jgi:hypothetical protein
MQPPLAKSLFRAYSDLAIAEDIHVIVGNLVNYVRDTRGIPPEHFSAFGENAEDFLTELDDAVNKFALMMPRIWARKRPEDGELFAEFWHLSAAYDQTVWLFAHILNEIQNGGLSAEYLELVRSLGAHDSLITFNWDTLLDRCLYESGGWNPDSGYGLRFRRILEGRWRSASRKRSDRVILKLHGSTNWLVPYISRDLQTGKRAIVAPGKKDWTSVSLRLEREIEVDEDGDLAVRFKPDVKTGPSIRSSPVPGDDSPSIRPLCFVNSKGKFSTFRDRYREGYEAFSYFYPPNHPITGMPTMPLIIPPTKRKLYSEFGFVFRSLWKQAEIELRNADEWVIVGFSFPDGDQRARELLTHAAKGRREVAAVVIVNPQHRTVERKLAEFLRKGSYRVTRRYKTFSDFLSH